MVLLDLLNLLERPELLEAVAERHEHVLDERRDVA
jgi:hypothetical protein